MKRRGIALIGAIIIMITIALLSTLMISSSSSGVKRTEDIYLQEQSQLLAKSAAEFALLAISGQNIASGCVNFINSQYPSSSPIYDINITIKYIGYGGVAGCENYIANIDTPESNGSVLLDVYVTSKDNIASEPIRYHRRSLQKL